MSSRFDFEYRSVPDSKIGTMQCSLCQKPIHSGDFRVYKKNRNGDWGYLVQHRACTKDDPKWAKIDAERARVPGLFDVGEYVGDIYFGNPDNPTQGTHRWDGSQWVELPSEQVALLELLVEARTRAEKLEAALDPFVRLEQAILNDVRSAHSNRPGATEAMRDDDWDMRKDLREAFKIARDVLEGR